jgi:hypothetical protein
MADTHEQDDEYLSIADAAAECGMSIEEFLATMVIDGLIEQLPDGTYLPTTEAYLSGIVSPMRPPAEDEWPGVDR